MKKANLKGLKLKQLSSAYEKNLPIPINKLGQALKDIRKTLGITQKQLAKKLNVANQSVVSRIEENVESCLIKTIEKLAGALECELIFILKPRSPLEMIIKQQAEKVARKILNRTYSNMAMEKQAPTDEAYRYQLKKLIDELSSNPGPQLWE